MFAAADEVNVVHTCIYLSAAVIAQAAARRSEVRVGRRFAVRLGRRSKVRGQMRMRAYGLRS